MSETPEEAPASVRFRAGIERMRRRWPAIAETADHPLTEVVLERCDRRSARERWFAIAIVMAIVGCIGGCLFISLPAYQSPPPAAIIRPMLFWGVILSLFYSGRGGRRQGLGPIGKVITGRASEAPEDLWLAPLSYRHISAIGAATIYLRRGKWLDLLIPTTIWGVVGAALTVGLAAWAYEGGAGPDGGIQRILTTLPAATGMSAAWISIFLLRGDLEIRAALLEMQKPLRRRVGGLPLKDLPLILALIVIGVMLALTATVYGGTIAALWTMGLAWLDRAAFRGIRPVLAGALLWIMALALFAYSRSGIRRGTERRFLQLAIKGQKLYEDVMRKQQERR